MKHTLTRREFLEPSALAAAAGVSAPLWQRHVRAQAAAPATALSPIARGPFDGTAESLKASKFPNGSVMPSLVYGRTGDRSLPPKTATGMRATYIFKAPNRIRTT